MLITVISSEDVEVVKLEENLTLTDNVNATENLVKEEIIENMVNASTNDLSNNITDAGLNNTAVSASPNATSTRRANCKHLANASTEMEFLDMPSLHKLLSPNTNISNISTPANCVVVMFYSEWCPFSAAAAPHFNALSRAYSQFKTVAVDITDSHNPNMRFGILAVPTLMLFHNGRAVSKFNETDYTLQKFADFLKLYSGETSHLLLNVTSADFAGPLPSKPKIGRDWLLYLSWIFILIVSINRFLQSNLWQKLRDVIHRNWREAEAQHEHTD